MLSLPTATILSTNLLLLSPRLSSKCALTHTHFHSNTNTHTLRFSRKQSLVEREGDASKGSVWTVAVIASPHPS